MTVIVPERYRIQGILERNGVACISRVAALRQDIRPLRIGILNIMPRAEQYEFNLLLPLGRSLLQIDPVWIRLESHAYRSTCPRHLARFYVPFAEAVRAQPLDGLVLTGAPVEELPFEEVDYWPELCEILGYAREHVVSTLGICWGGLALAQLLGIEKVQLPRKLFGVFQLRNLDPTHPLMSGLDDAFWCPQSRHAGIADAALESAAGADVVELLAHSPEAGYALFATPDSRFVMDLGHLEYNSRRLVAEARRDRRAGRADVGPLQNLDARAPVNCWRANRNEFFGAWIRGIYDTVGRP